MINAALYQTLCSATHTDIQYLLHCQLQYAALCTKYFVTPDSLLFTVTTMNAGAFEKSLVLFCRSF